jgi:uncharacterized protein YjgD (DUF1641 family)
MDQAVFELNQKVDALTAQIEFLTEEARLQKQRRQERDELIGDLTPIVGEAYRLSVRQLDEIEGYVQLEDITRVLKRLMRNTRNIESMLDQLEAFSELTNEVLPLTDSMFLILMTRLDEMERKGYFTFLQGGMNILDTIVSNFSEDDVAQLGENIVTILNTVKEMTQPEVMRLLSSTATSMREEDVPENVSMLYLMRQFNDPAVRKGLARTMNVLKTVSEN